MVFRLLRSIIHNAWSSMRRSASYLYIFHYKPQLVQGYVLGVLLVFSILALLANAKPYFQIDLQLTREVQENSPAWVGRVLQVISWPGYMVPSIVVTALVFILLAVLNLRWEAFSAVFAAISSGTVNHLLKLVIRRPRPSADLVDVFQTLNSYSFPSGHVMFYTTFLGFLLYLTFLLLNRSTPRRLLSTILGVFIFLVGLSRMYLGEHWASDVLGGYLLGSLILILTVQLYNWGKRTVFSSPSTAPLSAVEPNPLDMRKNLARREREYDHHSDRNKRN